MESDILEWQLNRYWYAEFCQKSILNRENAFILEHLFHISILGMNGDNTDSQKLNKIISEIQALQEVVARFRQLRLDATEFACLKCIVTFKAGKLTQTPASSPSLGLPPPSLSHLRVRTDHCTKGGWSFKGADTGDWPRFPWWGPYLFSSRPAISREVLSRLHFLRCFSQLLPSLFLVPTHSGSELRSFRNAAAIAALQDEAQLTLNSYIHTRWLLFALTWYFRKSLPLWMCEKARVSQFKSCDQLPCCPPANIVRALLTS